MSRGGVGPVKGWADSGRGGWHRDPGDWFDMRIPVSFDLVKVPVVEALPDGSGYLLPATAEGEGLYATFEFKEQIVGWPCFDVDAPEGTAARPISPDSSNTSTSTVGLPRESRISRALISLMIDMIFLPGVDDIWRMARGSEQNRAYLIHFNASLPSCFSRRVMPQ